MKNSKIIVPTAVCLLLFISCQESSDDSHSTEESTVVVAETSDDSTDVPLSSTAATHQDANHQLIRKADLWMEVENVYKSTTTIENKLAQLGGFVIESRLESHIYSREIFPIDADSAKEVKKYAVQNRISLRIPEKELGNFLISLGDEIQFLNFRNISAEDVSLSFIVTELEKERLNKTSDLLSKVIHDSGKIADKKDIINDIDHKQSQINQHKISGLKLKDDVAYSSVTLQLTEKEKITETMVINPKSFDHKYRPEFWYRAGNSIKSGLYFFQSLCIGFLYLWPIWLLGSIIFLSIKFYMKKMRAA